MLKENYEDYVKLRNYRTGNFSLTIAEEEKDQESRDPKEDLLLQNFVYIDEAETSKPLWGSYANNPTDIWSCLHYLPQSMHKLIK